MPLYKTIVLELLKDHYPALHERLRQERKVLETLDRYAIELQAAHIRWKNELRKVKAANGEEAISSEALELAMEYLQGILPSEPEAGEDAETFYLDAAMASLSHPMRQG
jgi:hypothetical protein